MINEHNQREHEEALKRKAAKAKELEEMAVEADGDPKEALGMNDHNRKEHEEALKRKEATAKSGDNEHNRKEHEEALKRKKH